jgi:hypothetical protein
LVDGSENLVDGNGCSLSIEKFVQIGKSLVAGLLSRKNQHRWVVKI